MMPEKSTKQRIKESLEFGKEYYKKRKSEILNRCKKSWGEADKYWDKRKDLGIKRLEAKDQRLTKLVEKGLTEAQEAKVRQEIQFVTEMYELIADCESYVNVLKNAIIQFNEEMIAMEHSHIDETAQVFLPIVAESEVYFKFMNHIIGLKDKPEWLTSLLSKAIIRAEEEKENREYALRNQSSKFIK